MTHYCSWMTLESFTHCWFNWGNLFLVAFRGRVKQGFEIGRCCRHELTGCANFLFLLSNDEDGVAEVWVIEHLSDPLEDLLGSFLREEIFSCHRHFGAKRLDKNLWRSRSCRQYPLFSIYKYFFKNVFKNCPIPNPQIINNISFFQFLQWKRSCSLFKTMDFLTFNSRLKALLLNSSKNGQPPRSIFKDFKFF